MKSPMRYLVLMAVTVIVCGCNTAGGILKGAGKDLQSVGEWVEPKPRERNR